MTESARDILLLDGALGTELGRHGVDISLPLWSARALIDAPELITQVHREYLEAGCDIITANTFRTHRRTLAKAGRSAQAAALTKKAVELALAARDQVNPKAQVFGSVAPLEDCYEPELAPDMAACSAEHADMIRNLLTAGVDGILIETMNNLHESAAVTEQARKQCAGPPATPWMISFCTKSDGPPNILLSGETLTDLLPSEIGALAVGVNCIAASVAEMEVKLLRRFLPDSVRIIAYANVGEAGHDGHWEDTEAEDPEVFADYAMKWIEAGASIVGGCCGTRPEMIRAIAKRLGR